MFGTLEGVTSARRLAELCTRDIPYLWICGGVSVNHHTLSDFRTQHGEFLKQVLTDSIAVLLQQELVTLDTVTQDGTRVRASAGSNSFRRAVSLEEARQNAEAHVANLRQQQEQDEQDGDGEERRRRAAQTGAAQERVERITAAKAQALWHVLAFNLLRMLNLRCPERGQSYLEVVMAS